MSAKKNIFLILLMIGVMFIFPTDVSAKTKKITCPYKVMGFAQSEGSKFSTPIELTYVVYDDGSVELPYKNNATFSQTGMSLWTVSADSFSKDFYAAANPSPGKYQCPDLSFDLNMASSNIFTITIGTIAADVSGWIEKGTPIVSAPEEEIKTVASCKVVKNIRGSSNISVYFTFSKNSVGERYVKINGTTDPKITTQKLTGTGDTLSAIVLGQKFFFDFSDNTVDNIFKGVIEGSSVCGTNFTLTDLGLDTIGNQYHYEISATSGGTGNGTDNPGGTTNPGHVDDIKYVKCGNIDRLPALLPKIISMLFLIIKIFVPIALIVFGMIDFSKAVMSGEDDPMKKSSKAFFRRLAAAAVVFLVVFIVQMVVSVVAGDPDKESFNNCFNCFINNNCEEYSSTNP